MTARLAHIWRHPIKSHGREPLDRVTLEAGRTLPGDRVWAVAHDSARLPDHPAWMPCANFMRGAKVAALMAIDARLDESARSVTLTHPDRPEVTIHPDDPADAARFLDWVAPLCPADRARPAAIVTVPERGMTDTDFPSVSINNLSSHRAVSQKLGRDLSVLRWRGNLILDGLAPWEEFDWIDREIAIGGARLAVRERIGRCMATTANPETGRRDADTLGVLEEGWGHRDFGVYAEVIESGPVALGDRVEVL